MNGLFTSVDVVFKFRATLRLHDPLLEYGNMRIINTYPILLVIWAACTDGFVALSGIWSAKTQIELGRTLY